MTTIRVHYPLADGEVCLRTEEDWDRDLRPDSVSDDRTCFEFRLGHSQPFQYFKPILRGTSAVTWAQGENYLALRSQAGTKKVYPHFTADASCSVCDLSEVASELAGRPYSVRVFTPPGYHENTLESFPVLYMQDGPNLFFREEAFGGQAWGVDATLRDMEAMSLIRRAIVVGVYPHERQADYTAPGCENYGRFLAEVLVPWVRGHYRTLEGPENTAVMGSSLGGVVSFFLGWRWPDVFGKVACLSSTFGWRDDLFQRVAAEPKRPIQIYLDSGWPADNYEVTRNMTDALFERGYEHGRDLLYMAFPNARHNEGDWAKRIHIPLQFFFGAAR